MGLERIVVAVVVVNTIACAILVSEPLNTASHG